MGIYSEEEEKNEALALRYHNDIFQKGNLEVADEILSPDFVLHNPVLSEEFRKGPGGTKKYGPLFGNPPTGKPYVATGFDLFRISNGKITDMWQQYNFASWP